MDFGSIPWTWYVDVGSSVVINTPLWGRIWVGKQQGICGNSLYLLLNFAVNLQLQKKYVSLFFIKLVSNPAS